MVLPLDLCPKLWSVPLFSFHFTPFRFLFLPFQLFSHLLSFPFPFCLFCIYPFHIHVPFPRFSSYHFPLCPAFIVPLRSILSTLHSPLSFTLPVISLLSHLLLSFPPFTIPFIFSLSPFSYFSFLFSPHFPSYLFFSSSLPFRTLPLAFLPPFHFLPYKVWG